MRFEVGVRSGAKEKNVLRLVASLVILIWLMKRAQGQLITGSLFKRTSTDGDEKPLLTDHKGMGIEENMIEFLILYE